MDFHCFEHDTCAHKWMLLLFRLAFFMHTYFFFIILDTGRCDDVCKRSCHCCGCIPMHWFFFLTESAVLLNVDMSPQTEIILHSIVIPFIFHLSRKNRWKKKQQLRHANRNKSTGIIIYGEIASFDHFFSTFTHS